jgi:cytochrome c oxidase cbb3-type subunit 3
VWIFVATIVFSAAYWGYYQLGPGPSVVAEYEAEARIASERAAALAAKTGVQSDETIAAVARDAGAMAKAKETFVARCAVCHGPQGQGLIGPNLTDEYWLHSGRPTEIFRIISDGEVEKGMVSWKGVLSPQEIRELSAYIGTLRGSNPPNPKPPQGDRVAESGAAPAGRR